MPRKKSRESERQLAQPIPGLAELWPDGDYEVSLPVGKGGVIHPQVGSMKPGQKITIEMTGKAAQALQNGPNDFELRKADG